MGKTQAQHQDIQVGRPRVVAIAADYDNCFDFIAPVGVENMKAWPLLAHWYSQPAQGGIGWTFEGLAELLETTLASITSERDEVHLFVGSARQSVASDLSNARYTKNGSCHRAYEIMAEERGWKLNRALLHDYGKSLQEQRHEHDFNWFLERIDKTGTMWGEEYEKDTLPVQHEQLKALIVTNVVAQLLKTNPNDEIDLYFFDDRVELLKAAETVKLPANIKLHTVWFDHYGFYTGDVDKSLVQRIPRPTQTGLTSFNAGVCAEDILPHKASVEEAQARMWKLEDPFCQKYRNAWQRKSAAPGIV
jgi:hypothetical protein